MSSPVPSSLRSALIGTALSIGIGIARPAAAATFTWDGGGADDLFGTAENWAPDGYPFVTGAPGTPTINGHKIVFGPLVPGAQNSVNINVGGNPDGFEFASGASAMTIYGTNGMQLASANQTPIVNLSNQAQTFSNTVRQFWIGGATTGSLTVVPEPSAAALGSLCSAAAARAPEIFRRTHSHTESENQDA